MLAVLCGLADVERDLIRTRTAEGRIRAILTNYDQKPAANYKLLCDRSIEFGGHPNPYGVLTAVKMETNDDQLTSKTTLALTDDPTIKMFAMKNVAQVGLTSSYIFQIMWKAKFELLRIRAETDALKRTEL